MAEIETDKNSLPKPLKGADVLKFVFIGWCMVLPLSSRICSGFKYFFKSQMLLFLFAPFFLLYLTFKQFLPKVFHCLPQHTADIIAKTFFNTAHMTGHTMAAVVKISCTLGILIPFLLFSNLHKMVLPKLFLRFSGA